MKIIKGTVLKTKIGSYVVFKEKMPKEATFYKKCVLIVLNNNESIKIIKK
jgi:hypothetical protein